MIYQIQLDKGGIIPPVMESTKVCLEILLNWRNYIEFKLNQHLREIIKDLMSSQIKWVEITLERSLLEDFQAEMERLQNKKADQKSSCKQVVPFLMNQFFKWTKSRDRDTYNYLKKLKLNKVINKCNFRLQNRRNSSWAIDLQLIFSKWDPDQKTSQQDLWIEFLRLHAAQKVEKSRMIRREDMKEKYIQQIKKLLEELNRITPYKGYLSIHQQQQNYETISEQEDFEEYYDYLF